MPNYNSLSIAVRTIANLSSVMLAMILLYSGVIHAQQPYYFIHSIASYELLPNWASGLVGLSLPYLQIVLAICIALKTAHKPALIVAAVLFGIFALAQTAVLVRGADIDCGCFGFVATKVSLATLALPICLLCTSILALRFCDKKLSSPSSSQVTGVAHTNI